MAQHPDEDELVALALGTLPHEPTGLLHHLSACPPCRATYDALTTAVDAALPAGPRVAAPPGFDARVLDRLGVRGEAGGAGAERADAGGAGRIGAADIDRPGAVAADTDRPDAVAAAGHGPVGVRLPARRRSRRLPLLVAAAVAAGIGLGGVGAEVLLQDTASVTASERGAVLATRSGTAVGTVEPSRAGDRQVMVMEITKGSPGEHYTCRLVLRDGSVRDAGQWWTPPSGRATWIAYGAAASTYRVELLTDDGQVWSSADLPD